MNFPFDKELVLENEFVRLSLWQMSDLENLLEVPTSDKALLQFSPSPVYSKELLKGYIEKELKPTFLVKTK